MIRLECYASTSNRWGTCLRDKITNKKIAVQVRSLEDKLHFLDVLDKAKYKDSIVVYGVKREETRHKIYVDRPVFCMNKCIF